MDLLRAKRRAAASKADESRGEIFLPGKRLAGAHESGVGMGLAIVRKIIDHHGGEIFVDPRCEQGAAFVFSLPEAKG